MKYVTFLKALLTLHIICYLLILLAIVFFSSGPGLQGLTPILPAIAYVSLAPVVIIAVIGNIIAGKLAHQRVQKSILYLFVSDLILAGLYLPITNLYDSIKY